MTLDEAHAAVDMMLSDNKLGDAGARVVIEEFLAGEEAELHRHGRWQNILPLATSSDHKRLLDNDQRSEHRRYGCLFPSAYRDAAITCTRHARNYSTNRSGMA